MNYTLPARTVGDLRSLLSGLPADTLVLIKGLNAPSPVLVRVHDEPGKEYVELS